MSQKFIDFHAHIYPKKIAIKATQSVAKFYDINVAWNGLAEELIESGSKIGITDYVVLSVATKANQVESINNFLINECKKHSQFIGFATYHQDYENFEKEIERVTKAGLKGIKLHPDFQKFQVDDSKMDNFYAAVSERNLPILIHAGDSRFDFSGPKRIANVLDKHPNLKVIAAHFGGYSEWDSTLKYLVGRKVWFDTSSTTWKLPYEKANDIIKKHGAEFFLFGSDFPMWDHSDEWSRFNFFSFTEEEKKLVLYENAQKLLNLK
ncbi:MAG: amidohydrolase family protein [Treponema sp.]|nr:amidohydrolase family protein [Treponema sp.]